MSTFVLVHGAFHGGWCWKRVTPLLREAGLPAEAPVAKAGHEVYTPTLTGLGERVHLANPDVGLETHITDVVNLIRFEDLSDVVLVGHSYSGLVVAGVADRVTERIARVVYVDAWIGEDGLSLADLVGPGWIEAHRKTAAEAGEPWRLPPRSATYFDVTDPDDVRWADARLVGQPLKTFEDRLKLTNSAARDLPCTYIMCTEQEDGFDSQIAIARARGWTCREIATGHDAMITAPRELANILLEDID